MVCATIGATSVHWDKDGVDIVPAQGGGAKLGDGAVDKRITIVGNGTLFIDGK